MNQNVKKNTLTSPWYSVAMSVAVVSGVFSLIVACMMIFTYIVDQKGLPEKEVLYSQQLVEMKALLGQEPLNEELKKEIRSLDLQLRQDYFQRRFFLDWGKYLLLVGVVIFVLALKKASTYQKAPRKLRGLFKDPEREVKSQMQARKAIGILGLTLLCGILTLAFLPSVELAAPAADTLVVEEEPITLAAFPSKEEFQKNWPIFRGPGGLGVSTHERIPVSWDGESGEGILWKAEIPLPGNNSPIVWGNRVFVAGAGESGKGVFCYSTDTGELLWRGNVNNIPSFTGDDEPIFFEETGFAASTMACDGLRVYAIFGNGDIACFDLQGQRVWAKNLGVPDSIYGFATSLTLYQNLVLIQYDQGRVRDNKSMLYALEGKTGEVVWQTPRPVANSWTSPIVIDTGQEEQLITCSEPWVIAYNPGTGEELWRADLLGMDLAPSPIYANGLVFVIQPNETLFAIRTDGRGDVTDTHVAWMEDFTTPDICSPVSNGELIFLLTTMGNLSCYDTQTGELYWEHEIDDAFMASPTLVGEWLYLLSEEGTLYRVKAAKEIEEGDPSHIDDFIKASPAFTDGRIYIRSDEFLYCIGDTNSI